MNLRDEWARLSTKGRNIIDAYKAGALTPQQAYRSANATATEIQDFLQTYGEELDAQHGPSLVNSLGMIFDQLTGIVNGSIKAGGLPSPVEAGVKAGLKDLSDRVTRIGNFAIPTTIIVAAVGVVLTFMLAKGK